MARESQKRWISENKDHLKRYHSNYYLSHRNDSLSKSKKYYRDNIVSKKNYHKKHYLYKTYGITLEEYNEKLLQQNGKCAICKKYETSVDRSGNIKSLAVDHNHKTGKIRSLLCDNCNKALGYIQDDIDLLKSFIRYLEIHE